MQNFCLAPIFSNHMVLQRNKPICIFGHAKEGITLTAALLNPGEDMKGFPASDTNILGSTTIKVEKAQLPADKTFPSYPNAPEHITFCITLPAQKAGGPYMLKVYESTLSDERTTQQSPVLLLEDIMVGEVWLAGGQSNMEYQLENDRDYEKVKAAPENNVRFYHVGRRFFIDENFYAEEAKDHWMCTDENLGSFSAVGYYFAEKLAKELNICVGIINCNLGGTSASAWMDRKTLIEDAYTKSYIEEYEQVLSHLDLEAYEKERLSYLAYHEEWQPKSDAYYREHPQATWEEMQAAVGICKWPGPMGPKHEFRPCGLYETMLMRIMPYTLGGFIYYQGESDEHKPKSYYHLLKNLIGLWRKDFGDETLPFLFVQLPVHKYRDNPASDSWCIIRQAQMQVYEDVPYTGIAVTMELGEYNNIHPTSKIEVGNRLASLALYHVYGVLSKNRAYGPLYDHMEQDGNTLKVTLKHVENHLILKNYDKEDTCDLGFEICDESKHFYKAQARIEGNTIILSNPKVLKPIAVRYLWVEYAPVYLYGENGIPLAPFHSERTFY